MEQWKEYRLGEIGKIITGKTPRTAIKGNYGGTIPFLTPSDDMACKFVSHTNKTLTPLGLAEVKNCLLPENSICVSCIGSDLGKVVKTQEPSVTNQQINSIIPYKAFDADFVYYLMCIVGKDLNFISKTSTAVPIVNKSTFSNYKVRIPQIGVQKAIGNILSSLDDKIELNRKINSNLEEQAKALFKSWFIDFEPFKGGKFVDSELGMIPEGWKVGTLSEVADITMGASPNGKSYNKNGDGAVFYQGRAEFGFRFPHRSLFTSEPKKFAETNSTLLSVRAPVGDINMANEKCCIGRGLASIKSRKGYNSFIFYLLASQKAKFNCYNSEGTVFGCINKQDLENFKVVIPNQMVINKFQEIVCPIDELIKAHEYEAHRVSLLRDTLLPKLMSGEIDVEQSKLLFI